MKLEVYDYDYELKDLHSDQWYDKSIQIKSYKLFLIYFATHTYIIRKLIFWEFLKQILSNTRCVIKFIEKNQPNIHSFSRWFGYLLLTQLEIHERGYN